MLLALILFSIVSVLSAVLASMWQAELQVRNQEKNSLQAFYLAQAGIEEAKACVKKNSSCVSCTSASASLGGANNVFSYALTCAMPYAVFNATGQVKDSSGNILAQRRILCRIEQIGTSSLRQTSWAWDEI